MPRARPSRPVLVPSLGLISPASVRALAMLAAAGLSAPLAAVEDSERAGATWKAALAERGIALDIVYTLEVVRKLDGGVAPDETMYLDNLDLTLGVDTAEAGLWSAGEFFLYVLANHGDDPSSVVGDLQATSNFEAEDSIRVFELWYQHAFADDRFALLGGLHDLNSEFYTSDYAGLFFNSSFGIGPEVAGSVPVSIFNLSTVGVRARFAPDESWTVLAAVYDGEIRDRDQNPSGLELDIDPAEHGVFAIAELQYHQRAWQHGTYRLGVWHHSGDFTDFASGDGVDGNSGIYLTADQWLHTEADGEDQGLAAFLQLGYAREDRSEVSSYLGLGLNYVGLLPGREGDIAGIAFNHAERSDDLADAGSESVLEITYAAELYPGVSVQPNYQYVRNPGATDADVDDAHVVAVRLEVVAF